MALTQKKQGARLDHSFSDMIDDAIPAVTQTTSAAAPSAETVPDPAPAKPEQKNDATVTATEQTAPVKEPPAKRRQKAAETADTPKQPISHVRTEVVQTTDLLNSDLDAVLSVLHSNAGRSKTVYLDEEVHQYIQEKSDRYGTKYSTVVNLLLRKAIEMEKRLKS